MDFFIPTAMAQAAGGAAQNPLTSMVLPMVAIFAVFYFFLIRPQNKRAKEHRDMVSKLATGDEVVTSGGMLGKITEVGDTFVSLEIAKGVEVRVQRAQVSQLLPKGTVKGA
jgi:preprotein translocase subunit YajC